MKKVLCLALLAGSLAACEKVDTTVKEYDPVAVPLEDVARILAALPVGSEQWNEVHTAVQASTENGYDSEYTLKDLFTRPGAGVGAAPGAKSAENDYTRPMRDWIGDYVNDLFAATKASETGEVSRSGHRQGLPLRFGSARDGHEPVRRHLAGGRGPAAHPQRRRHGG